MHNQSLVATLPFDTTAAAGDLSRPGVRAAQRNDAEGIAHLVSGYVTEGLMLPRTVDTIAINIDNYVVAVAASGIIACASLDEYSPSLAEVSSVAVSRSHHGGGLGTQVVLGVERLARARNITELFALSLSARFFLSLDYTPADLVNYPEKLARYEALAATGVQVVPKKCFQKMLGTSWQLPQLVKTATPAAEPVRRAS